MKKTIVTFFISAFLLAAVAIWALKGRVTGNIREVLAAGGIFVLVGFALFIGVSRLRSHLRREPSEDELSRNLMTRASSLAYYISIYLWLFIMYISDRATMPVDSLIGAGILGMALAFFFSWLFVKLRAKND